MFDTDNIRVLCFCCKQTYETAGYKVIGPLPNQKVTQPCDICTRLGYEYVIDKREVKEGGDKSGQIRTVGEKKRIG